MNQEMFDKEVREAISAMHCPQTVDVVDAVMARISKTPSIVAVTNKKKYRQWRFVSAAAACVTIVLGVGVTVRLVQQNDHTVGALVNDVSAYIEDYTVPNEYYNNQYPSIDDFIFSTGENKEENVEAKAIEK